PARGAWLLRGGSGALSRGAGIEGAPHGLEHAAHSQRRAAATQTPRESVGLLRPFLLCRADRARYCRCGGGLSGAVRGRGLARQRLRHAIPSGEEPADWTANAATIRGMELSCRLRLSVLPAKPQAANQRFSHVSNTREAGSVRRRRTKGIGSRGSTSR